MIKMIKNLRKTWKNKIVAIALMVLGYLSTLIENDGTAFILLLIIALPIFFTKEDCITMIIENEKGMEE
jgi:hypothetical protein